MRSVAEETHTSARKDATFPSRTEKPTPNNGERYILPGTQPSQGWLYWVWVIQLSRFLPTYSFCTHSPHIIRFIPSLSSIVNLATIPYLYITVVARYVAGVGHERGGHAVRSLCDVCLSRLRPFFLTSD